MIEGKAGTRDSGCLGGRMDVFERLPRMQSRSRAQATGRQRQLQRLTAGRPLGARKGRSSGTNDHSRRHRHRDPPHRRDADEYRDLTDLEGIIYHRVNPPQGLGLRRGRTSDGELNEATAVPHQDVVPVPEGCEPCGVPHGCVLGWPNLMAGPLRTLLGGNHPDHDWI